MEKYDVIIVGAGPAGSTAAYYCNGLKVLIVDKCDFPRHKACGGGLMSSRDWHLEFENYARIKDRLHSHSLNSIMIYWNLTYVSNRRFKHLFDQVSRYEFDDLLLRETLKKDTVSFLKFDVKHIKETYLDGDRGYVISDGERDIFTPFLIGADGFHSVVSKFLGNSFPKRHQFGYCMEYEIVCEKKYEMIRVFPGYQKEIGYAWIFPTREGYQIGIGITRKPRKSLKIYLDLFMEWAIKEKMIPEKYCIKNTFGGAIPLHVRKKYCTDNILLCGDAMGLVKLLTGEGIYYAMKSGKIAGNIISQNFCDVRRRYQKAVRPLIWDTFLTPYIPPKFFTIIFWTLFFRIGKVLDALNLFNIPMNFFIRMIIRRMKHERGSYYYDEKITVER